MNNPTRMNTIKRAYLILLAFCALSISALSWAEDVQEESAGKDIMATASEAGLVTFVKALEASGLDQSLQGEGPFTVFAPSDAAFAELPEGKLEALMMPENQGELRSLLGYHIVNGRIAADVVVKENASVTTADIEASNGVIHIIDAVLPAPTQ